MKKIVTIIASFGFALMTCVQCYAASLSTAITGSDTFSDSITLKLQANYSGISTALGGLCGLSGYLNYDSNKLTLSSISAQSGFDLTQGAKIVLYKSTGVASGTSVLSVTFKNKGLAANESTTVSFAGVEGSDGNSDFEGTGSSKTIKYVPATNNNTGGSNNGGTSSNNGSTNNGTSNGSGTTTKPNTGINANTNTNANTNKTPTDKNTSVNNSTTKKDTTKKNTTTTSNASNNSSLSSLSVDYGDLVFSQDVFVYDVVVGSDVEEITVLAEAEDSNAEVIGAGKHSLKYGLNDIQITVKAKDGSESVYSIKIVREKNKVDDNGETKESEEQKEFNWMPVIVGGISLAVVLLIIFIVAKKKQKSKK